MKKCPCWLTALCPVLIFSLAQLAIAQPRPTPSLSSAFTAGLRFDYFSRTISWDDDKATSKLTSYFGSLVLEYKIQPGFSLAALLGYSSSTFDGLVFRKLPLSIDFDEGGGINGLIWGGEINKILLSKESLDIEAFGQFLAYLGSKKEWAIPGLAVSGTIEGKPSWMRACVGPVFTYRGWENFSIYLYPSFDYLWGTFEMKETIQTLGGKEDKEIKGKSQFGISLGANFDLSANFSFKGEAGVYPYKDGMDYSVMIKALFSF
jgi:hypothetical protein